MLERDNRLYVILDRNVVALIRCHSVMNTIMKVFRKKAGGVKAI